MHGPMAKQRLSGCLERIAHRGPDTRHTWHHQNTAIGFNRLSINGSNELGKQPYQIENLVGAFNGEIYNHVELARDMGIKKQVCDTHVLVPAFKQLKANIINRLDGFYSGIIFNKKTQELYCLRDYIGKKPLFLGSSGSEIFITSELKSFESIEWFSLLPQGCSKVDLKTGIVTTLALHMSFPKVKDVSLTSLLNQSVVKRLPAADQPIGVFLSGGLDSSIIARFVSERREDAQYFVLGGANSADKEAVALLKQYLNLRHVTFIDLPAISQLDKLISKVVYATQSFNPSIVSNGIATYLLAQAAKNSGIKVVLCGEGADELFGGYHYHSSDEEPWVNTRLKLIEDMQFTELRRLDMSTMVHGVEARCPFLDPIIKAYSDQLDFPELYAAGNNKIELRRSMSNLLPESILNRKKTSLDVGSGIRGMVVSHLKNSGLSEREALRKVWRRHFSYNDDHPYFSAYPVFDQDIDRRGASHR